MKNIILLLVILVSTALPLIAQDNQPSKEEIDKVKKYLQTEDKSIVDVLDKGVDKISGFVTSLEGMISKYSPEVWRIMVTQQYSKAVGYPLYYALVVLVILIIGRVIGKCFGVTSIKGIFVPTDADMNGREHYDIYKPRYWFRVFGAGVVPIAIAIPFIFAFLYYATESIMIVVNPEYYAIKDIIGFVRK